MIAWAQPEHSGLKIKQEKQRNHLVEEKTAKQQRKAAKQERNSCETEKKLLRNSKEKLRSSEGTPAKQVSKKRKVVSSEVFPLTLVTI